MGGVEIVCCEKNRAMWNGKAMVCTGWIAFVSEKHGVAVGGTSHHDVMSCHVYLFVLCGASLACCVVYFCLKKRQEGHFSGNCLFCFGGGVRVGAYDAPTRAFCASCSCRAVYSLCLHLV